jgi:two-component system nitrate/nitrite response regulator NarL
MSSGNPLRPAMEPPPLCSADPPVNRNRTRIFLLSDVRLYREGLSWSLSRHSQFEVIGADDYSLQTLTHLVELRPEVVILDIGAAEALAMANALSSRLPITKIIAFAVSEVDDMVLACAEAGVAGYVAPEGSASDLVSAVEFALRDELYCSPRIAYLLSRRIGSLTALLGVSSEAEALTRRERQILDLIGAGKSNKEIGRALKISNSTVKNHVHNILDKLRVNRRGEAAAWLRAAYSRPRTTARRPSSAAPLLKLIVHGLVVKAALAADGPFLDLIV